MEGACSGRAKFCCFGEQLRCLMAAQSGGNLEAPPQWREEMQRRLMDLP